MELLVQNYLGSRGQDFSLSCRAANKYPRQRRLLASGLNQIRAGRKVRETEARQVLSSLRLGRQFELRANVRLCANPKGSSLPARRRTAVGRQSLLRHRRRRMKSRLRKGRVRARKSSCHRLQRHAWFVSFVANSSRARGQPPQKKRERT